MPAQTFNIHPLGRCESQVISCICVYMMLYIHICLPGSKGYKSPLPPKGGVCMHAYDACTHLHACTCICRHACMYACMHGFMHTNACVCTGTCHLPTHPTPHNPPGLAPITGGDSNAFKFHPGPLDRPTRGTPFFLSVHRVCLCPESTYPGTLETDSKDPGNAQTRVSMKIGYPMIFRVKLIPGHLGK